MDELIWKIFKQYDRSKHFFNDPFPHIFFEKALTEEEVEHAADNYNTLPLWRDNYKGDWRIDYLANGKENFYQKYFDSLTEEFSFPMLKGLSVEPITLKNKNTPRKLYTHSTSFSEQEKKEIYLNSISTFSKYNQEVLANPNATNLRSKERVNACLPHHDLPTKVFVTLLYLKQKDDDLGGDLELYYGLPCKRGNIVDDINTVVKCKTIKYEPGNMIIFPNSPVAFHAVTQRKTGIHNRYMFCLSYDTNYAAWINRWNFNKE